MVISEIWTTNIEFMDNLFPGYTFIYEPPKSSHVGGVGIYYKKQFKVDRLDELKLDTTNKTDIEDLWINIQTEQNLNFTLGAIYRHPNSDINRFNDLLDNTLPLQKTGTLKTV